MQVPDLPFHLKQTGQLYDTMVFKLLSIRQLKTMIPERWETNEVSPAIVLAHCQGILQKGGIKVSTVVFLTGTDEAGIWRRPRYLAFTGENTIQERAAQIESPKDLQRIPYKPSAEYWSVHEKLPKVQGRFIQKY